MGTAQGRPCPEKSTWLGTARGGGGLPRECMGVMLSEEERVWEEIEMGLASAAAEVVEELDASGGETCDPDKSWIKFHVVDDASGKPVSGATILVRLADGSTLDSSSDSNGFIDIENIDPGCCEIYCDLDGSRLADCCAFMAMGESPSAGAGESKGSFGSCILKLKEYKVKTGDTLASIAQAHGLSASDLSKFNWGTSAPEEVKKKMEEVVGCTKKDASGNYKFDDSDKPGIVYVPQQWLQSELATEATHTIRVRSAPKLPTGAKIKSVEFLNGDDATELTAHAEQFVNLPRDAKWVDGTHVKNVDRLGQKPRIKVTFNKPGKHTFKVKYVPDPGNVAYSAAEKGRNANFKFEEAEKTFTTDDNGAKIIAGDLFVAASGKAKYQVKATDDVGNEALSHQVHTQRLVYYVELKMNGTVAANSLGVFTSEFAKHNVKMVSAGSAAMDRIPNIGTDTSTFETKARTAYNTSGASAKAPYVVAVAYTDHLAVKDSAQEVKKSGVTVGPGKSDVEIPIVNSAGKAKYLWKNIVPGEGWFVSASFLKNGGTPGTDDVAIPEAKCTAIPAGQDDCKKVKVKVDGLAAATGTITLKVNWVNRMRGGISIGGGNMICVCTRAWWANESTADQNQVMVHEMGHKIGMVPGGTGKGPDKTPNQYTGKGHVGSHCHTGLPVQASYSEASGTCVMFGSTNNKSAFCADCVTAVKKEDLSSGWSAF